MSEPGASSPGAGYLWAGTWASRISFAVSSCAWNCLLAIRVRIASPNLKNPPGSPSKLATTFVPPPLGSNLLLILTGNGLSTWVANRSLGTYSTTSAVESILRPRNLARCWILVPTRTGVSDGCDSSTIAFHSGSLAGSARNAKTSSIGRLI